MLRRYRNSLIVILGLIVVMSGCGGDDDGGTTSVSTGTGGGTPTTNSAPVANAGPDQGVITGSVVTLSGGGSSDADGNTLSYSWTLVTRPVGSAAALSSATVVSPTFTADIAGTYIASLTVNDGAVNSAADTVTITAFTPVTLPGTGQDTCYDASGTVIDCAGTGQDGENGGAWPVPRFTDVGDGTVTDNLTGQMWLKDANCIDTQYPGFDTDATAGDGAVTWQNALDFVKGMNAGTYSNCNAGHTDWRLPNRKELRSIIDYSQFSPALPAGHPYLNVQISYYWASTTYAESTDFGIVGMLDGFVDIGVKESGDFYVWPVRDAAGAYPSDLPETGQTACYDDSAGSAITCTGTGQDGELRAGVAWPSPRFADNGDGTVTDVLTGLVWLKDANCIDTRYPAFDNDITAGDGAVTWQHALDFVKAMNAGTYPNCSAGKNDWRLPNINELESLINAGAANTASWLNGSGFSNAQSDVYWASTTNTGSTAAAWCVNEWGGGVFNDLKSDAHFVWPVRTWP